MLSYNESLKILKETNALLEGHFILSSGLHSAKYVQCAQLLSKPIKARLICESLAQKIKKKFRKIDLCLEKQINNFNRQALHAKSLGFVHPKTKREIFFEAKRPKDFDSLIKNLKKASI